MKVGELKKALEQFDDNESLFMQCDLKGQVGLPLAAIENVEQLNAIVLFPDWEHYFRTERKLEVLR